MRAALLLIAISACGKVGFDELADGAVSTTDADPTGCPTAEPTSSTFAITATGATRARGSCGGGDSPEVIFPIEVPEGANVVVAGDGTGADTVVYLSTTCAPQGTDLGCDLKGGAGEGAAVNMPLPAGRYYAIVDGQQPNTSIELGVEVQVELPLGASCPGARPYWKCGPDLQCTAGRCVPLCATPANLLSGALTHLIDGTTVNARSLHAGTCGDVGDGGRRAPEVVYLLRLTAAVSNVEVTTDDPATDYDTLLYMRAGCLGAEIDCNDDIGGGNYASRLVTGQLAAGDYYVFADGFANGEGQFRLTITVTP